MWKHEIFQLSTMFITINVLHKHFSLILNILFEYIKQKVSILCDLILYSIYIFFSASNEINLENSLFKHKE